MYRILDKRVLNQTQTVFAFDVEAPLAARKALPGQFIVFQIDEYGERIPVTIAAADRDKGVVTIIVQAVGKSTRQLSRMQTGESLASFSGPLGRPTCLEGLQSVCIVGGGVGTAIAYPVARAMHDRGIRVDMIAGFRSADSMILEQQMRRSVTELFVTTDDGSFGERGTNVDKLRALLDGGRVYDEVLCMGPAEMMRCVCAVTAEYGVKTVASLDPIMLDGTGMCGACRVTVGGETKFACVDGPEFDGHLVDWESVIRRGGFYEQEERQAMAHVCRGPGG